MEGRPRGVPNPDGREWIRRDRNHLYDALLNSALAGDAEAIRLCLEIIGEHPKILSASAPSAPAPTTPT